MAKMKVAQIAKAGADFDLAADPEGVDALVSWGLMSTRANDLPVVVLCAAIDGLNGLPSG